MKAVKQSGGVAVTGIVDRGGAANGPVTIELNGEAKPEIVEFDGFVNFGSGIAPAKPGAAGSNSLKKGLAKKEAPPAPPRRWWRCTCV